MLRWTLGVLAGACVSLVAWTSGCGDDGGGQGDADVPADEASGDEGDAGPGEDGETCADACAAEGTARCDDPATGRWVCVRGASGCLEERLEACTGALTCHEGACLPCSGEPGTLREQSFVAAGSDERFYFLHVPAAYDCGDAWPLLVDLHGTAGPPQPEEAYGLADAVAAADRWGFLLLRPRSRSSGTGAAEVFRWDQNPGDPERNHDFLLQLVEDLGARYHLDPARLAVMGFSSGTNQTAVALEDPASPFSGFGFVGGGSWTIADVPARTGRVYLTTGFRDYMRSYHDDLRLRLSLAAWPTEALFERETDAGHELYGWMYEELWPFLDTGARPASGAVQPGWTAESSGTTESLVALASLPSGELLAAGQHETMRRRAADGTWSAMPVAGPPAFGDRAWTSVCLDETGTGVAVGGGMVARSTDGGATWTHQAEIPEFGAPMFGYSYLNGVACGAARIVATGYWSGVGSSDGGATWGEVPFDAGGYRAQGAAIRVSAAGTWLAVGYWGYVARSIDGASFATSVFTPSADWILDAAPAAADEWVMVGENGLIWRSTDDGRSFGRVAGGDEADLYAVAFRDATTGLAVGRGGAAWLTTDGGGTWRDCRSGLDGFLGDVRWLVDGTAVVVGEQGTALHFDPAACGG
jgi:photosystem II stability/assembly factor-like uncharacterized protein/predicted esterase